MFIGPRSFILFIQYELTLLENLTLSKSFPNNLTSILNGVNMMKYTIAITMGAINLPNNSPNLIQNLFKGVKIFRVHEVGEVVCRARTPATNEPARS